MKKTSFLLLGVVAPLMALCMVADCIAQVATNIQIVDPVSDTLVLTSTVTARGDLDAEPGAMPQVIVQVLPAPELQAVVNGNSWEAKGVQLPVSLNLITAKSGTLSSSALVTRGSGLSQRPRQKVRIEWDDNAIEELKGIAEETLDDRLTSTQLEIFAASVRSGVLAVLADRFQEWDIEFVEGGGSDVHIIRMLGLSGGIFGQSPYDCGSHSLGQTSQVWVGTYRDVMSRLENWPPMQASDPLQVRIEDVIQALGRTSAHELGHSLGLVGQQLGSCGWMRGCHGGHNCPDVDERYAPLTDRFDSGRYIMDPGQLTENHWRLAELTESRGLTRRPAVLNLFNRSYLSIVHPK